MKSIKIVNVEIIDNSVAAEIAVEISEISVEITIEIDNKELTFQFQTANGSDYNSFNHNLELYISDFVSETATEIITENENLLLCESNAQKIWDDYIEENYDWNPHPENSGFYDANSENRWAVKK